MKTAILSVATTVPKNTLESQAFAEFFIDACTLNDIQAAQVRRLSQRTGIINRYSVLGDFTKSRANWSFFNQDYPKNQPSTYTRNEVYMHYAPQLALEAAQKAIKKWDRSPTEITHIISVSCTGMMAPGIEFFLHEQLGIRHTVQRYGLNFMGCFGAFRGLALADAFAQQSPNHRVLVVCTELCSLHIQTEFSLNNIIGNALFADGSAAVIVGAQPRDNERALWEIEDCMFFALPNSRDVMTWKIGEHGYVMNLGPEVPEHIGNQIVSITKQLLADKVTGDQCEWLIHPGGKSIISVIEKACNLTPEQTLASWDILANYGNMSSPTFLFVLERALTLQTNNPWAVGLAFGPGLSVDGMLLKKPD
jgi:predicted naringenin-chalcone synthase